MTFFFNSQLPLAPLPSFDVPVVIIVDLLPVVPAHCLVEGTASPGSTTK